MVQKKSSRAISLRDNTSVFRVALLIDLILCQIGYIDVVFIVAAVCIFLWGLSLFTRKYIYTLNIKDIKHCKLLLAFIGSNIITILIQGYDRGMWESLGMIFNITLLFFMYYGVHTEAKTTEGRRKIYKEIYAFSTIMLWLSLIINTISIISLYVIGQSINYYFGYLVVYENRFTGIYYNPNLMAFTSFCAMFCCHLLWQGDFYERASGKPLTNQKKALILFSAGMNLVVIFLTDSNASMLIIVCYVAAYIFYKMFGGRDINIRYALKKGVTVILLFAMFAVGIFAIRLGFQTTATQTMTSSEESSNVFEDREDELNKITFEHTNKNLDSGRIKLFKQGINVIKHHPLFGVGKGEITKYGNRYNDNKMKYSDLHNGYLTLLVSSGFIGFGIFMAFSVLTAKEIIKTLFSARPMIKNDILPCIFAFLASYCVYALFERTLVYGATLMVYIFWAMLGYAMVCVEEYSDMKERNQ